MPQFLGSDSRFSHPAGQHSAPPLHAGPPLQLVVVEEQTPCEQTWLGPQTMPQPPQLFGSVAKVVQVLPQQVCPTPHPCPPLHVGTQLPPLHTESGRQVLPHEPQLFRSFSTSMHAVLVPQHASPGGQTPHRLKMHWPPEQAVAPGAHASPQPPQFDKSEFVFTQLSPQQLAPNPHPVVEHPPAVHDPPRQAVPGEQTFPQ